MFAEESVLAAAMLIAVAIVDGLAPASQSTTVFRRGPFGQWSVQGPFKIAGRWNWIWRPIIWTSVIWDGDHLSRPSDAIASRAIVRRWRRVSQQVTLMQGIAAIQAVALIIGLPLAAFRHGVFGVLGGLVTLLYIGVLQGAIAGRLVRRLTGSGRTGVLVALRCLWPFVCLRGADGVFRSMRMDGPALIRIVGEAVILEAYRAALYDAVAESSSDGDYWLSVLGRERVLLFLQKPSEVHGRSCPRCACLYLVSREQCVDCGIPLAWSIPN